MIRAGSIAGHVVFLPKLSEDLSTACFAPRPTQYRGGHSMLIFYENSSILSQRVQKASR